jgi:hypothetical protein
VPGYFPAGPANPWAGWPPSSGNPSGEVFTKGFIYEQKPVANALNWAMTALRIVSIGDASATNAFTLIQL